MARSLQDELKKIGIKEKKKEVNRLGRAISYQSWLKRGRVPASSAHRCCYCGQEASGKTGPLIYNEPVSLFLKKKGFPVPCYTCKTCLPFHEKHKKEL